MVPLFSKGLNIKNRKIALLPWFDNIFFVWNLSFRNYCSSQNMKSTCHTWGQYIFTIDLLNKKMCFNSKMILHRPPVLSTFK
jgi:hypothetical protein